MKQFMRMVFAALFAALAGPVWCDPVSPLPDVPVAAQRGIPVLGRVLWPGKDVSETQIRVYSDAKRRDLVDLYRTAGPRGSFVMSLDPGTYWITIMCDQNKDGKPGPGDGIGFYGVSGVDSKPQPLRIDEGSAALVISIPVAFEIKKDGRGLQPVAVQAPSPYASASEVDVSGKVRGRFSPRSDAYVLLIPVTQGLAPKAALVDPKGRFSLPVVPGKYYAMSVENFNGSDMIDPGDFFAVPGYEPVMGPSLPPTTIPANKRAMTLNMDMQWALSRSSRLRSGDGTALGARINVGGLPSVVTGTVTRDGKPVPGALVRAYIDQTLRQLYSTVVADDRGRFCMGMTPATYYVIAVDDKNGDGVANEGDGLAHFGADPKAPEAISQPLSLKPGGLRSNVELRMLMVVDAGGAAVPAQPVAPVPDLQ